MSQVPPHAEQTELAILATVMLEPDSLVEVRSRLNAEDFYGRTARRTWQAIEHLDDRREPVDPVSVLRSLHATGKQEREDSAFLEMVLNVPVIARPEKHASRVAELSRLRRLIAESHKIAAEGYEALASPREFVDDAEQRIFAIAQDNIRADRLSPMRVAVTEAIGQMQAAQDAGSTGVTGVPSGLTQLDKKTTGWHPGDVYVVAGRPGMGKTGFALTAALHPTRPRPGSPNGDGVAFFSLEMPRDQLAMRALGVEAKVGLSRIRSGQMRPDDWGRLTASGSDLGKLPLWLDDTPGLSLLELRAKVRRIQAQCSAEDRKLGLVVIDYLQLMQGPKNVQSREQEVSALSRGLKELAKEFGVPVMALSQLNRSVETRAAKDKRPQLSDLRESGAIEQDADAIFFLYRDEYYFKDTPDQGIAEIIVAKQRNGPTGTVKVRFQAEFTRFDNLAIEEYEMGEQYSADDYEEYDYGVTA